MKDGRLTDTTEAAKTWAPGHQSLTGNGEDLQLS
jgi:hypothetical protein